VELEEEEMDNRLHSRLFLQEQQILVVEAVLEQEQDLEQVVQE
jgi:hypothetical protein